MNGSGTVSAEVGLRLVVAEQTLVPLMASLYYSSKDPYAVRVAFHIGTDEPVEWIFARDLLAAGLTATEGDGDVRVWPSTRIDGEDQLPEFEPDDPLVMLASVFPVDWADDGDEPSDVLNIELSSPFGQARFEVPAAAIVAFLGRTYSLVAPGNESEAIDIDAELDGLLWQT